MAMHFRLPFLTLITGILVTGLRNKAPIQRSDADRKEAELLKQQMYRELGIPSPGGGAGSNPSKPSTQRPSLRLGESAVEQEEEESMPEILEESMDDDAWEKLVAERAKTRKAEREKMSNTGFKRTDYGPVEAFRVTPKRRGIFDNIPSKNATELKAYISELTPSATRAVVSSPRRLLVDVRERDETGEAGAMFKGALNWPLSEFEEGLKLEEQEFVSKYGFARPREGDEVVLYCMSGMRAGRAAMMMLKQSKNEEMNVSILSDHIFMCPGIERA
eukprot:jgi/Bigna1/131975/aug1.16_g6683